MRIQQAKHTYRIRCAGKHFAVANCWGDELVCLAELVALREDLVVAKPKTLTMEQAAALPTTALTALQALRNKAKLQAGQDVLVNGASGGVGMAAVQIAKTMGATVTAVCSESSFPLIKGLGADRLIDYRIKDFTEGSERFDVVFDCVGNQPHQKAWSSEHSRRLPLAI